MFYRLFIFLSSISLIVAFFLPYIDISVNQASVLQYTGFDMLFKDIKPFAQMSMQQKLYFLILPGLGVYASIAFFLRWHSALYIVPALAVLGQHGYLIYQNFDQIQQFFTTISNTTGLIKQVANQQGNPLQLQLSIIGYGAYLQTAALFILILFGFKDPLNKTRKIQKPAKKSATS